jgi:hypothetical protein
MGSCEHGNEQNFKNNVNFKENAPRISGNFHVQGWKWG